MSKNSKQLKAEITERERIAGLREGAEQVLAWVHDFGISEALAKIDKKLCLLMEETGVTSPSHPKCSCPPFILGKMQAYEKFLKDEARNPIP